jgi:hypothetical protein
MRSCPAAGAWRNAALRRRSAYHGERRRVLLLTLAV